MRFLLSFVFIIALAAPATSQSFNCTGGRIIYAKKYTDLFSTYPGTAAVVETCAATCESQPPKKKQGCFLVACGLACLAVGFDNCADYFTKKKDVDSFKDGIEAICKAEKVAKRSKDKESDLLSWSLASAKNTLEGYQNYLKNCNSECRFRAKSKKKVADIHKAKDEAQWAIATQVNSPVAMRKYLKKCSPTCAHSSTAKKFLRKSSEDSKKSKDQLAKAVLLSISLPIPLIFIAIMSLGA